MGLARLAWIACAMIAVVVAFSGCGATSPGSGSGTVVGIGERDFHIAAPREVPGGRLTLRVHNAGPDTHELFVVRSPSTRLSLRTDRLTVDEDAIKHHTVASIDAISPGETRDATLRLPPGHYLLFCNMSGHFRGGMHRELIVR